MFCTSCGAQLPDGLKFCTNCGAPLQASADPDSGAPATSAAPDATDAATVCPACGAQVPSGLKFCTNCGAPLQAPGATDAATRVMTGEGATPQQGAVDQTTVMPGAAASGPDYGGMSAMPDGYGYGTDAAGGTPPEEEGGGHGLVIAAAIMGVLAVVAVVALVVVVVDPFGLHLLGGGDQQEQPAVTEPAEKEAEKDAEPEEEPAAEPKLQAMTVQAAPSKVDYLVGESLDATGLKLALTYDDGSEDTVAYAEDNASDFTFDPTTFDAAGGLNVTVTYGGLSATFAVTVSEPVPDPAPTSTPSSGGTYVLPDSSTRLYSADELSGLSDWELYVARNEIYARHGRMFQKQDLQDYFNSQSWYTPLYSPEEFDSMGLLSSTEQQNASTILSVEQSRGSSYI
ncbi:YARHG domain-containing protein [Olsenella uli]|uniref:YARHG domain-containing protein n=1 Tax=Olsenella uli TaxID=133926 RepID=UPI001957595E|nr:YARHG domain-containing protein [Olsenella uli]MBM6676405.1 YARHG domain-containing protein [Olsenella uli]